MDTAAIITQWLEGVLVEERQSDSAGVFLTLAEVCSILHRGKVDFSGTECQPCNRHTLEAVEHTPGDNLPWWRLNEGIYALRFNERVKAGAPPMLIVPTPSLINCGCLMTSTIVTAGEIRAVMFVPKAGVTLKQNARVALLRPLT